MRKPDITTFVGLIFGPACLLGGNILEGGHTSSLIQPTAALIVWGGTIGCLLMCFEMKVVLGVFGELVETFLPQKHDGASLAETIVDFARRARKDGLVSLESDVAGLEDEFFKKALMLALDGMDSQAMRTQLETAIGREEHESEQQAKFFEMAGAFAPTMGIVGAVMGLIHVMGNLSDVNKVGAGIAVAFVATIYGIGSANLVFLPWGTKGKARTHHKVQYREMAMEGAIAIQEGMNPREVESLLQAYTGATGEKGK